MEHNQPKRPQHHVIVCVHGFVAAIGMGWNTIGNGAKTREDP